MTQALLFSPQSPIILEESAPASPSVAAPRHDSVMGLDTSLGPFPDKGPRSPKHKTKVPSLHSDSESDCEYEDDEADEYESTEDESHLLLHTRVYALAEKYDIPNLKVLAKRKFEMAMACYYDAPEFADAIEEVYCSTVDTDRGLRSIVLKAFQMHPRLATTPDVYDVIKETPSLAFELYKIERGIPV